MRKRIFIWLFYYFSWECRTVRGDYPTGIYESIHTELTSITDYHSEFYPACTYEFFFHHDAYMFMVVSEISDFRTTSDIYIISDDRVTDIREMWYG